MGGEWIGEEIKSGRKLLRDDGGLDQGINWREERWEEVGTFRICF